MHSANEEIQYNTNDLCDVFPLLLQSPQYGWLSASELMNHSFLCHRTAWPHRTAWSLVEQSGKKKEADDWPQQFEWTRITMDYKGMLFGGLEILKIHPTVSLKPFEHAANTSVFDIVWHWLWFWYWYDVISITLVLLWLSLIYKAHTHI